MTALLIIDMQRGLFEGDLPRYDAAGVVNRINLLSKYFSEKGDKVIFIQHDGQKGDTFEPFTEAWEILPSLIRRETDLLVRKTACDSFYKTALQEILHELEINELVITGCATDFCVDTTIRSALSKDYDIIIVEDGHTTADREHAKAEVVIKHHNYVWANLILPGKEIKVMKMEELLKILSIR
ncbi:MAG: cysteine hydrolase family protein [bacterium]